MSAEEWRRVDIAPDYEVSDRGRVRSYRRVTPKILKATVRPSGHLWLNLSTPTGTRQQTSVHQLVARAFIGPVPEGMEVRHLDGDPTNNDVRNLRYGTRSENTLDSVRHGTHHLARKTHCPRNHPYDEVNTYPIPTGGRGCRACRAIHRQRHRERSAAA